MLLSLAFCLSSGRSCQGFENYFVQVHVALDGREFQSLMDLHRDPPDTKLDRFFLCHGRIVHPLHTGVKKKFSVPSGYPRALDALERELAGGKPAVPQKRAKK